MNTQHDTDRGAGARITIDMSPAAREEIERMAAADGLTVPDLVRHALSLYRLQPAARLHEILQRDLQRHCSLPSKLPSKFRSLLVELLELNEELKLEPKTGQK